MVSRAFSSDRRRGADRLSFHVPEKYPLTVIALRLLGQFRLVNVVLPFRHLGCSRIPPGSVLSEKRSLAEENARAHEIRCRLGRPKYEHEAPLLLETYQPLASSLTKMAAPANNRKQFPISRAAALRVDSAFAMRSRPCITTPVTSQSAPPSPSRRTKTRARSDESTGFG